MADGPLENVVQELRRIAGLTEAAGMADGRLLEVFSATSEPAALEVLVRRYGPMVFGVCRRVLRHTQDAEDAFQATFLVLVRKAAGLRRGETLGNWLYGVAYRTALQARTRSARRRRFEAEVPPMDTENSALESTAQLEIQKLLDRELNRLPEKFRSPIILCDLLGKTLKQAAVELHCPEGTVSSRLARGRERLKKQLEHHAPTLAEGSAPLMAIGPSMIQALPAGLCMNTVKAAVLVANGTTMASLSPSVAAIVQGVMKSMLITKLKPAVLLFIGFGLLSGMTFVVASGMGVGSGPGDVADKGKVDKPAPPAVVVAEREAPVVAEVQPPPKMQEKQKEKLRYDGKDFNAWLDVFQGELKPELKIDAMKALRMFAARGYAEEATAAIIGEMKVHDAMAMGGEYFGVLAAGREALSGIGDVALEALSKELQSKRINDRLMAVKSIEVFPIEKAQPLLLLAISDNDVAVRYEALYGIATSPFEGFVLKPSAKEREVLVPILASLSIDKEAVSGMPSCALEVLGWFGPDAAAAVPTLIELLKNSAEPNLQAGAAETIAKIGPAAKEAVPALIQVLREPRLELIKQELAKLKMLKANARKVGLTSYIPEIYAARALASIGPDAKEAVPALKAIVNHSDEVENVSGIAKGGKPPPSRRWEAAHALAKLGGEGIAVLIEAAALGLTLPGSGKPNNSVVGAYNAALSALTALQPPAREAVPVFVKLLGREDFWNGEEGIIVSLGRIGPDAKEGVPVLLKRLEMMKPAKNGGSLTYVQAIVVSLGEIGPGAKEAIPKLNEIREATEFGALTPADLGQLKEAAAKALEKIQK